MRNPSFVALALVTGLLYDGSDTEFPYQLHAFVEGESLDLPGNVGTDTTYFGYVHEGPATLVSSSGTFDLTKGMYFSCSTPCAVIGGRGIVIARLGYRGMFNVGGPIEQKGRLRYIDGCTDSLLIPPVKLGDACLNHLHFPPDIDQTSHTHPSVRVGMVTRGHGECVTPWGCISLNPGYAFLILPGMGPVTEDGITAPSGTHAFRTFDVSMDVVAFHPDSDFGPQDEDHPMINRTIVEGVSARLLPEIQTRAIGPEANITEVSVTAAGVGIGFTHSAGN